MVKGTVNVTSKGDPRELKRILDDIGKLEVYVGIPAEESSREDEIINNAELAYIHTHGIRHWTMRKEMQPLLDTGANYSDAYQMYMQAHGSPLWHSPPRPIIEPAIEKNRKAIADKLQLAVRSALNGDEIGARQGLEKAGMFAAGKVKKFFTDPDNSWAPNAESTIKAKGSARPLIDTGALRQSITYVVRDKDG